MPSLSPLLLALQVATAPVPPRLTPLKQEAVRDVETRAQFTQQMVDQIFSFGELGFQETETSHYLVDLLRKNGFTVREGIFGIPTAWVALPSPNVRATVETYAIAADGPRSRVRESRGIGIDGPGDLGAQLGIYFHADLSDVVSANRNARGKLLRQRRPPQTRRTAERAQRW